MLKWLGRTAVITGAAQGIGRKITEDLAEAGMRVIALDFTKVQMNKIEDYKKLNGSYKGKIIPLECDVRSIEEVKKAFKLIEEKYGGVDVLINNAAVYYEGLVDECDLDKIKSQIDTNLLGVFSCTKEAINSMKKKQDQCYIIMMNSVCGLVMPSLPKPTLNAYFCTKAGMTALNEQLRRELRFLKLNIKVTNLCPGLVDTEAVPKNKESSFFGNISRLDVSDISDIVKYLLSTSPSVHIEEIVIRSLHEPL